MKERTKGRRVYLLNYADDRFGHKGGVFSRAQQAMNLSAARHGIQSIVSWSWQDLAATDFYRDHAEYLNRPYHLNGFVFKPYITLRLLEQLDDDDVLLYYDSGDGSHLIDCSIEPLLELCRKNAGTVLGQWGDSNSKWTKRDCFVYMNCDEPRYHRSVALQATWFVLQRTRFTVELAREWLDYTLDERVASYENAHVSGLPDLPGFVENRGDQSVLSNLAVKHGIRTFPGAGGHANRRIGEFIRSLSGRGWVKAMVSRQKTRLRAIRAGLTRG